jgi:hypothetical protein
LEKLETPGLQLYWQIRNLLSRGQVRSAIGANLIGDLTETGEVGSV